MKKLSLEASKMTESVQKKQLSKNDERQWEDIKEEWLDLYHNKKEEKNLSTNQFLTDTDEWLCENFMSVDYNSLSFENFRQTVNDYFAFLVKEGFYYEH